MAALESEGKNFRLNMRDIIQPLLACNLSVLRSAESKPKSYASSEAWWETNKEQLTGSKEGITAATVRTKTDQQASQCLEGSSEPLEMAYDGLERSGDLLLPELFHHRLNKSLPVVSGVGGCLFRCSM